MVHAWSDPLRLQDRMGARDHGLGSVALRGELGFQAASVSGF